MLVTAEEWLARILADVGRLPLETLPVALAHGRTLAQDVRARHDLPLWASSAMDGFALRSGDAAGASPAAPARLAVTGEVLAGSSADPRIAPGEAVRIMTGAPLPRDADAVVPVELASDGAGNAGAAASWGSSTIGLAAPVAAGANVRARAEDVAAGSRIAAPGTALTAARLAAIAAAGVGEVAVSSAPRVAVLATGDELRSPGSPLERGQIAESNSLLISGLLRETGVHAVAVERCDDDTARLRAVFDELAPSCDAIITTGGVGPGSRDLIGAAVAGELGVVAAQVAVRPGRPQRAGRLSVGPYLFALPGNPVAAAVSFELFVRPALLAMQGRHEIRRRRIPAVAGAAWRGKRGQLQVQPVVFERCEEASDGSAFGPLRCLPAIGSRGASHAVGSHGAAEGYALVGSERGDVAEGEPVEVIAVLQ